VNEYGVIHSSYWDSEICGVPLSAGGRDRTTARMMTAHTFRGWDHMAQWAIDDGSDYPRLAWEETPGEPIGTDPLRYGGGTGEPNQPFQIWTADEFSDIGRHPNDWDKRFVLMSDLDLAETDWDAIWSIGTLAMPFSGRFDGNGYSIAGFTYLQDIELYAALFGSIGPASTEPSAPTGTVSNLNLEDVDVSGLCNVGGLAGYSAGTISSCSVTGRIVAHGKNAGGLIGYNVGTVQDCVADCNVTAEEVVGSLAAYSDGLVTGCSGAGVVTTLGPRNSYAGGLIGENDDVVRDSHFAGQVVGQYTAGGLVALNEGTILHCSAHATISGTYLLGGLVGYNEFNRIIGESFAESVVVGGNSVGGFAGYNNGQIRNGFATGQVTGDARIGGLIGQCGRAVAFCYSTCLVSGQDAVGGLIGEHRSGEITSCFWDMECSGLIDGVANQEPDPDGTMGRMTAALQMEHTFTAAGWDFTGESENGTDDIWTIEEGLDYPRLVDKIVYDSGDDDDTGGPGRSR